MIISPNHTSFTVADMDRSLAFYCDLLGFELVNDRLARSEFAGKMSGIPGAELRVVYVQAAGYKLELIQYLQQEGEAIDPRTNRPGSAHLCFNVDDVDAYYELVTSKGFKAKAPPLVIPGGPNQNSRGFYFTDPDGFTIELIQPASQAS